jgi:beta-mannosidase
MQQLALDRDWQLREYADPDDPSSAGSDNDEWMLAVVPGTVHQTLIAAGRIPDPFYGLNERDVQWVGERDWLYRCEFEVGAAFIAEGPVTLCCTGLDTIAVAWLNGEQVLTSDNMFVPRRASVTELVRPGSNTLTILFKSALRYGKEQEAVWGQSAVWNGDASRVYVRKAQYHYGWDWGPCLLTAGPWRPIFLEAGAARVADLHCPTEVTEDLRGATLPVHVLIERERQTEVDVSEVYAVRLRVNDPAGTMVADLVIPVPADGLVRHDIVIDDPELWWPNSYGPQPLYRIDAELTQDSRAVDHREMRIGIRRLRLVQEPVRDEPGTTFLFEINNTPIFCGGANWIPADSFTTRLTPADYRLQLEQAAAAHMVMLRVWGGGIYEDDAFYDLCDELGLMVWQDFMFACGLYPAHEDFQRSVRAEAEAQVPRLRRHPCLVLWCGNNEDYQIAESQRLYDPNFEGDFTTTDFPARAIYERLLPEICGRLDPLTPYWPGSPYGGTRTTDQTIGDRHTWDIWHGATAPYNHYPKYEGRFVSEFGMESCPALETIAAVTPPAERYPQSRTIDHHNKSSDGPRRLAMYLNDTLRAQDTLEDYIYATQFVQAEALTAAYRGWRRRWHGPGRYAVAGALVWQLNDCWPVTSWAIVDYERRPKPAYYAIRRELAPVAVGLARAEGGAAVWALNGTRAATGVLLRVEAFNLDGQIVLAEQQFFVLVPNAAAELGVYPVAEDAPIVVAAHLIVNGVVIARSTLWPEPFKYFALSEPSIMVERLGDDRLRIEASRPAKGVWLTTDDKHVTWSDNMIDLVPGRPQVIEAAGLGEGEVRVRRLQ